MQLRKVVNHGNTRWRVSSYVDGERKQRFFVSKELAIQWMQELRSDTRCASFWSSRSPLEQKDIIAAFDVAQHRELTLLKAVLTAKNRPYPTPKPLAQIIPIYLSTLKFRSLREASFKQIHLMLNQLSTQYGTLDTNTITPTHIEQWFAERKWARSTIDGVIAKIGPFFTWCGREGYCESNPCKAVKRPMGDDSPPAIFTPSESRKLLLTALSCDPGMIPYLAIGLFAGVRPLEIQRLQQQDITDQYIEITAAKAKTRKRRLVSLSKNLKGWLRLGGDLPPINKPKRLSRILQKAGLEWKPDIMRHSYASYHLAFHQSADKTALEMGHRDTQMLFRHYRELVTKEEAQAYWKIEP